MTTGDDYWGKTERLDGIRKKRSRSVERKQEVIDGRGRKRSSGMDEVLDTAIQYGHGTATRGTEYGIAGQSERGEKG